jgi:hypothetical protein
VLNDGVSNGRSPPLAAFSNKSSMPSRRIDGDSGATREVGVAGGYNWALPGCGGACVETYDAAVDAAFSATTTPGPAIPGA